MGLRQDTESIVRRVDELSAGGQHAKRFVTHACRIADVLEDRVGCGPVERAAGEREPFGIGTDQRRGYPRLLEPAPTDEQPAKCDIHADAVANPTRRCRQQPGRSTPDVEESEAASLGTRGHSQAIQHVGPAHDSGIHRADIVTVQRRGILGRQLVVLPDEIDECPLVTAEKTVHLFNLLLDRYVRVRPNAKVGDPATYRKLPVTSTATVGQQLALKTLTAEGTRKALLDPFGQGRRCRTRRRLLLIQGRYHRLSDAVSPRSSEGAGEYSGRPMVSIAGRVARHVRLSRVAREEHPSPPFLVLFINSICNMRCEHCFYWQALNKRDDLSVEELFALSDELGPIENLNLSGGEPFLRKEFAEICRRFVDRNGVRQIYVPTNGYFTDKTVAQVTATLLDSPLDLFVVELSLDGMAEFHDEFRGARNSFQRAMETYDALVEVQDSDPRLRIHSISTATEINIDQIRELTAYLYERCPRMDHHNLAIIRGDRKNPSLRGPVLDKYESLFEYIRRLWAPREEGRYGAIVEPMLQWAKVKTAREERQVVPCTAGRLTAVVHANGDVAVCEAHAPLGNLRERSFTDIWRSAEAAALRKSIRARECHCTTEVFLWPSITFQPIQLARAMVGGKVWRQPAPLPVLDQSP